MFASADARTNCVSNACDCDIETMREWQNSMKAWKTDHESKISDHESRMKISSWYFTLVWKIKFEQWLDNYGNRQAQEYISSHEKILQNYIAKNEIDIDWANDNYRSLFRLWGFPTVDLRRGSKCLLNINKLFEITYLIFGSRTKGQRPDLNPAQAMKIQFTTLLQKLCLGSRKKTLTSAWKTWLIYSSMLIIMLQLFTDDY